MCENINKKVADIATRHCAEHRINSPKSNIPRLLPRERRSLIRTRRHTISNINFWKYVKVTENDAEEEDKKKRIKKLQ